MYVAARGGPAAAPPVALACPQPVSRRRHVDAANGDDDGDGAVLGGDVFGASSCAASPRKRHSAPRADRHARRAAAVAADIRWPTASSSPTTIATRTTCCSDQLAEISTCMPPLAWRDPGGAARAARACLPLPSERPWSHRLRCCRRCLRRCCLPSATRPASPDRPRRGWRRPRGRDRPWRRRAGRRAACRRPSPTRWRKVRGGLAATGWLAGRPRGSDRGRPPPLPLPRSAKLDDVESVVCLSAGDVARRARLAEPDAAHAIRLAAEQVFPVATRPLRRPRRCGCSRTARSWSACRLDAPRWTRRRRAAS